VRARLPCWIHDSRPDEATKPPVGRFESDRRRRRYCSSDEGALGGAACRRVAVIEASRAYRARLVLYRGEPTRWDGDERAKRVGAEEALGEAALARSQLRF